MSFPNQIPRPAIDSTHEVPPTAARYVRRLVQSFPWFTVLSPFLNYGNVAGVVPDTNVNPGISSTAKESE